MVQAGSAAPDFCLPVSEQRSVCLGEMAGKWLVVFFYPKDDTPG